VTALLAHWLRPENTMDSPAPKRVVDPAGQDNELDTALVQRFRAGERHAFDELVRRHQRAIYYLALRYLGNDADAADLTQKTFVRAFKSLDGFRGAASLRTWLYRIAINLSLNHIRDHRREVAADLTDVPHEDLAVAPLGASRVIEDQNAAAVRRAIEQLPPKQRMVLELRIYDELSFREVAELAGCSENSAKVNFHHAVKRLRAIVAGDSAPPEETWPEET
jgi:RNA polymerase sigma-70 factor (ECF subfamily)